MPTPTFTFRANLADRQLIRAVAQKLERSESDAVRLLVRQEARRLGLAPATHDDRAPAASRAAAAES